MDVYNCKIEKTLTTKSGPIFRTNFTTRHIPTPFDDHTEVSKVTVTIHAYEKPLFRDTGIV